MQRDRLRDIIMINNPPKGVKGSEVTKLENDIKWLLQQNAL